MGPLFSQPPSFLVSVSLTDLHLCAADLTELELPSTMKTEFANPDDVLNFTLTIEPDEGKLLDL